MEEGMKKIRVHVQTNRVGSKDERVIEVEADLDEKNIEDAARDEMFNMIEWGYEDVPADEK